MNILAGVGHDAGQHLDDKRTGIHQSGYGPPPNQASLTSSQSAGTHYQSPNYGFGPVTGTKLVLPATDQNQRDWTGYSPLLNKQGKIRHGLDCPIRAGPHGNHACSWRPRDGDEGFPDMARVREHIGSHGLVCTLCGQCFGNASSWKRHRKHFEKNGCTHLDALERQPQHPLSIRPELLDRFFRKSSLKDMGDIWLEGYRILHGDNESAIKNEPSPYYRQNVDRQRMRISREAPSPSTATATASATPVHESDVATGPWNHLSCDYGDETAFCSSVEDFSDLNFTSPLTDNGPANTLPGSQASHLSSSHAFPEVTASGNDQMDVETVDPRQILQGNSRYSLSSANATAQSSSGHDIPTVQSPQIAFVANATACASEPNEFRQTQQSSASQATSEHNDMLQYCQQLYDDKNRYQNENQQLKTKIDELEGQVTKVETTLTALKDHLRHLVITFNAQVARPQNPERRKYLVIELLGSVAAAIQRDRP
ncbi:hypothetical protein AC578_9572 [Pseudocercospora eumusae]|uniref:Uncharacterized protein n=1 Tax=Pseudocercospora eumusae TaxID=321146 RepID=A0A139GY22_9PEZI|nr:hypothetical protein AC578_9572 [Pseudocercospora eumusae]